MGVGGASGGFAAGQNIGLSVNFFSLTLRMEGNKQCELQAEN